MFHQDDVRRYILKHAATSDAELIVHAGGRHDSFAPARKSKRGRSGRRPRRPRPDAVLSDVAVFLLRHLRAEAGGARAERELRSCLAIVEDDLCRPPFASSQGDFTSGATAARQDAVRGTLRAAARGTHGDFV